MKNDLMELPKCPTHGTGMIFRPAKTPEQAFCGAWYECAEPGCYCTVLIPTKELIGGIHHE